MNKKIFTLLAGTFLMLATVSLVSAQTAKSYIDFQTLQLGAPVTQLQQGANAGYYHLKLDYVGDGSGNFTTVGTQQMPAGTSYVSVSRVLYMGQQVRTGGAQGSYGLFVDALNSARTNFSTHFKDGVNSSKAEESAAALWCVSVNEYNQGKNVTFDFVNKHQKMGLEVQTTGYGNSSSSTLWTKTGGNYTGLASVWTSASTIGNNLVPGNTMHWEFSMNYRTAVDNARPLISYVTTDSVAVICVNNNNGHVYVKIASAVDVKNNKINETAYFTLVEAMPFTLSALDFNTMLGTQENIAASVGKLVFDPNVNGSTNPFTMTTLRASDIHPERIVVLNILDVAKGITPLPAHAGQFKFYWEDVAVTSAGLVAKNGNAIMAPVGVTIPTNSHFDVIGGKGSNLTDLGYIHLRTTSNVTGFNAGFLTVDTAWYIDRPTGTRSLKFVTRAGFGARGDTAVVQYIGSPTPGSRQHTDVNWASASMQDLIASVGNTGSSLWKEALMFNQSVWRLVYYPSGDSIYINPYQAAYLPKEYQELGLMNNPYGAAGDTVAWNSLYNQASNRFTYRAYPYWEGDGNTTTLGDHAYLALDPTSVLGATGIFGGVDETTNEFARMTARLKYGKNPARTGDHLEYQHFHKLYVSLQDLTNNTSVVTLRTSGVGSIVNTHRINTRIHTGLYEPCSKGDTDLATVPVGVYLIRNKLGEYLHVPLYSATDSAKWVDLEPDVHPEYLPSFQWIVQKENPASAYSSIKLINREYPALNFENILFTEDWDAPFPINYGAANIWAWNKIDVNEKVVNFGTHNTTANRGATFIKLSGPAITDPFLGYTNLGTDSTKIATTLYAFEYINKIDKRWINAPKFDFWDYPATDTTVYVIAKTEFDKLYFEVRPVGYPNRVPVASMYGFSPVSSGANAISGLVQLKRFSYQLVYRDPYKYICDHELSLRNDIQGQYALGKTGAFYDFLGQPTFHLRHYHYFPSAGEAALTGYKQTNAAFALVQRVDSTIYSAGATQRDRFLAYIQEVYGKPAKDKVEVQLTAAKGGVDSWRLGFFVAAVDDQTAKLKASLRADAATRVSTFMLKEDTDPLYRRFNVAAYDGGANNSDKPRVLRFHNMDNNGYYELFENTGQFPDQRNYWAPGTFTGPNAQKNYLGLINTVQYPNAQTKFTPQTAIYVDTAYVNRGTGHIKPQYMLVVRPQEFAAKTETNIEEGCVFWGGSESNTITTLSLPGYVRGMYLINATDSAKRAWRGLIDNRDYIWNTNWERLVFTDAIHYRDSLFIIGDTDMEQFEAKLKDGTVMLDMAAVVAAARRDSIEKRRETGIRRINLADNFHKDVVFSMRLIERGSNDFIIESESSNRIWGATAWNNLNSRGRVIAPCDGGWIKIQNGVPVISRSDEVFRMPQAFRFNTKAVSLDMDDAVANETVAPVAVIGNDGFVTILNAAGKKVVISNILGQTVANAVLSSDNATIAAPKGVVIVAIEGEAAVKALVK